MIELFERMCPVFEETVQTGALGGHFILGTGNEIGMYSPPENSRAMVEAARHWKYD